MDGNPGLCILDTRCIKPQLTHECARAVESIVLRFRKDHQFPIRYMPLVQTTRRVWGLSAFKRPE